jgi:hypothetical protein
MGEAKNVFEHVPQLLDRKDVYGDGFSCQFAEGKAEVA